MKKEKYTPVSTSDLLPGSLRSPESQTVPEVERVRRYPDRSAIDKALEWLKECASDYAEAADRCERYQVRINYELRDLNIRELLKAAVDYQVACQGAGPGNAHVQSQAKRS